MTSRSEYNLLSDVVQRHAMSIWQDRKRQESEWATIIASMLNQELKADDRWRLELNPYQDIRPYLSLAPDWFTVNNLDVGPSGIQCRLDLPNLHAVFFTIKVGESVSELAFSNEQLPFSTESHQGGNLLYTALLSACYRPGTVIPRQTEPEPDMSGWRKIVRWVSGNK